MDGDASRVPPGRPGRWWRLGTFTGVVVWGFALSVAVAFASLFIGDAPISVGEVLKVLWSAALGRPDTTLGRLVVLDLRLPRAVVGLCVGGALGAAGCMFQGLLRNPLASPSVIGTSAAAGFGAVAAIFFHGSYPAIILASFACAVASVLLVLMMARTRRGLATDAVILTGISIGLFFAALTGLVEYLSEDSAQLSRMVLWLLGGLWALPAGIVRIVGPLSLVALVIAMAFARDLDLLSLGEADALRLGVRVARKRWLVLTVACLLTSLAVSVAGVIAFVGLVVPHAARRLLGPAHLVLLPASVFLGGIFVVAADSVSRSVASPNELPLGVVTSIVGVPIFLLIMRTRARRGDS